MVTNGTRPPLPLPLPRIRPKRDMVTFCRGLRIGMSHTGCVTHWTSSQAWFTLGASAGVLHTGLFQLETTGQVSHWVRYVLDVTSGLIHTGCVIYTASLFDVRRISRRVLRHARRPSSSQTWFTLEEHHALHTSQGCFTPHMTRLCVFDHDASSVDAFQSVQHPFGVFTQARRRQKF